MRRPPLLLLTFASLLAACGGRTARRQPARTRAQTPIVYGFYTEAEPPVAPGSYFSFVAHAGAITTIAPFWFRLKADGSGDVTPQGAPGDAERRALVDEAHRVGVRVDLLVHNLLYPRGPSESSAVGALALRNHNKLVSSIVRLVRKDGFDGVHLDLEMLPASSRNDLTAGVRDLRTRLRPRTVTLSVFPSASPTQQWTGTYDYAALARASDGLVVMSYDEHTADGSSGPLASLAYVQRNLAQLARLAPANKLILGLAAFGFDWPQGQPGQYLSYTGAVAIARAVGINVRLRYAPRGGLVSLPGA